MACFLVIAATSCIGQSTAKQLIAEGHQLFLTGRNEEKLAHLANTLQSPSSILDATDFSVTADITEQAIHKLGKLDGMVNCAGSLLLKPAHLTTATEYAETIAASLTTAFATVHAAGKHLGHQGGSIVLISSAAALAGLPNHEVTAAAKAGIIGLIQAAASTYAVGNLRFNAVAPGLTRTPLTHALIDNPTNLKLSESMHALGRLGEPEDIARAICFLLDPKNSWITGQVLAVDGGLSKVRPKVKVS
ncbi:MAG: SDR family NAD(P)-dependent oxidoreductase [Burkholderiales bacterium]